MKNYYRYMKLVLSKRLYKLFIISLINTIIPSDKLLARLIKLFYLNGLRKDVKINSNKLPTIFETAEHMSEVYYRIDDVNILRIGVARRIYLSIDWIVSEMTMSAHKYLRYRKIREHEVFNAFKA